MNLAQIKEALKKGTIENPDAISSAIETLIESETQKGVSNYNSKDKELGQYKQALKEAGYDKERYPNVKDWAQTLTSSVATKDAENSSLLQRITALETKDKETSQKLERKSLMEALSGGLKDFAGSELIAKDLISEGKVKLVNGEAFFVSQSTGADGNKVETLQTFADGIKTVAESYKHLKVNDQTRGPNLPPTNPEQPQPQVYNSVGAVLGDIANVRAQMGIPRK